MTIPYQNKSTVDFDISVNIGSEPFAVLPCQGHMLADTFPYAHALLAPSHVNQSNVVICDGSNHTMGHPAVHAPAVH